MRTLLQIRLRSILPALVLAVVLAGIYLALNYREIVHGPAIMRALDPGFPSWKYAREIVTLDQGGTHAQAHLTPILSCANPAGFTYDIWLVRRDGWWWLDKLEQGMFGIVDC